MISFLLLSLLSFLNIYYLDSEPHGLILSFLISFLSDFLFLKKFYCWLSGRFVHFYFSILYWYFFISAIINFISMSFFLLCSLCFYRISSFSHLFKEMNNTRLKFYSPSIVSEVVFFFWCFFLILQVRSCPQMSDNSWLPAHG